MSNLSFQIPDLLALTNNFTFRMNKHCKLATHWSEKWLLSNGVSGDDEAAAQFELQPKEREDLRHFKYGLLASLTSPTSDAPQLKVIADFLALVFMSHVRILKGSDVRAWDAVDGLDAQDGLDFLKGNTLLCGIVPQLRHIRDRVPELQRARCDRRLLRSAQAFAEAQTKLRENLKDGVVPTVSEYIELRSELYGSSMFVNLLDLLEVSTPPHDALSAEERVLVDQYTMWAMHIVAWILDIFSYASGTTGTTRCNSHNLISLLTTHRNLSVQGAMNYCGGMIKEALEELQRLECELLPSIGGSPIDASASWGWFGLGTLVKSAVGIADGNQHPRPHWKFLGDVPMNPRTYEEESGDTEEVVLTADEVLQKNAKMARYLTAMKDWIVGTINWGYETELYFGQKGDEVRSFGWVFLAHNE